MALDQARLGLVQSGLPVNCFLPPLGRVGDWRYQCLARPGTCCSSCYCLTFVDYWTAVPDFESLGECYYFSGNCFDWNSAGC